MQIHNLCGKAKHETNEDAQRELAYLLTQGANLGTLTIYDCPFCSTENKPIFHVGNQTNPYTDEVPQNRQIRRRGLRRWLRS